MYKRMFIKFSAKFAHETRNNLKHFRDVVGNPLNPRLIFLFSRFMIVGNTLEKRTNGFSWNFHWNVGDDTRIKWLARQFHAWLDCFTVSHLGVAACLLAALRQNGWMDFYEICRICRLWHKIQTGTFWGLCVYPPGHRIHFSIVRILVSYQHDGIMDGWTFVTF